MPTCPECRSIDVYEDPAVDEITDGQGYSWTIRRYYTCNDCGCEYEEEEETQRTVTITNKGKGGEVDGSGNNPIGHKRIIRCT